MHKKLDIARRERRMTQVAAAKLRNIGQRTYQLKEQGKRNFTLKEAQKLAKYFNTTVDELFANEVAEVETNQVRENTYELVFEDNGEVVTDSLIIAEMFGKRHDNVLSDIKLQVDYAGQEFSLTNFGETTYTNERGRMYSKYNLTEEAFTLVVFGYNTKEAVQTKIRFIEEFKRKKDHIQNQQTQKDPMSILKLIFEAMEAQNQELQHMKLGKWESVL